MWHLWRNLNRGNRSIDSNRFFQHEINLKEVIFKSLFHIKVRPAPQPQPTGYVREVHQRQETVRQQSPEKAQQPTIQQQHQSSTYHQQSVSQQRRQQQARQPAPAVAQPNPTSQVHVQQQHQYSQTQQQPVLPVVSTSYHQRQQVQTQQQQLTPVLAPVNSRQVVTQERRAGGKRSREKSPIFKCLTLIYLFK